MASNGGSDVEPEEDKTMNGLPLNRSGRAAEHVDFAIIWSFLENFRGLLHFPVISLEALEHAFDSHSHSNESVQILEELQMKLLRRMGVSVQTEKWERALLKVAREQSLTCAWDLEQFGYAELPVESRLEIFKVLLECQFDQNNKLKCAVNKKYEPQVLRQEPIGRDQDGLIYWYHEDDSNGMRLYSTEEDELDAESWRLLAADTETLTAVIEYMEAKSEVNPKEIALVKWEEQKKEKAKANKKKKKGKKKDVTTETDDDNPCARCYSNVQPESILLCDKCDAAYHTACLRPPLLTVPKGDWFCPFCQQVFLLETLQRKKAHHDLRKKLRQRQAKRLNFNGINLSNILQKESDDEDDAGIRRSGRARKTVDYTFKDFDEDINEAVDKDHKRFKSGEEIQLNGCGGTRSQGFPVDVFYANAGHRTRRSRRLRDLDDQSDTESKTSEFEYKGSSEDEGPQHPPRHVYLRRNVIEDDDDDEECEENGALHERTAVSNDEEKGAKEDEGEAVAKKNSSASRFDSSQGEGSVEDGVDESSVESGYSKPKNEAAPETRTSLQPSPAIPVPPAGHRPQPVANALLERTGRDTSPLDNALLNKRDRAPSPLADLSIYLTPDMCNKEDMFPEIPLMAHKDDAFAVTLSQTPTPPKQQQGFPGANFANRAVTYGVSDPMGIKSPGHSNAPVSTGPHWSGNNQYNSTYGLPGYSAPTAQLPSSPVGQRNFTAPLSPASGMRFTPPVPNSPGGFSTAVPNSPGNSRKFPPPTYSQAMAAYSGERSQYGSYNRTYTQPPGVEPGYFPPQQTVNQFRDTGYHPQPQPPAQYAANRHSYPVNNLNKQEPGATPRSAPWTFPDGGMFYAGTGVGTDPTGQTYG